MKLARNAATVTALGFLGMVTGVILDAIIVALFGLGQETDAYFIATTIPLGLVTIIHQQVSKVVQPAFVHLRTKNGEEAGWRFLRRMMTAGSLVVGLVSILGVVAAGQLVSLQSPGQDGASHDLSRGLIMAFFAIPALSCPGIFMNQALVGLGHFGVPGASKTVENLAKIVFSVCCYRWLGIYVLPLGWLLGVALQNVMLYRALLGQGFRFRPDIALRDPQLVDAYRRSGYPLIGHLTGMAVEVVQNALASYLGSGSLSALRLGTRIIDAMSGLFANSVVTAVMPMVTQSISVRDFPRMKAELSMGARLLIAISLPASVWLAFCCRPLIGLLFERMNFSAEDTTLVCGVLVLMAPYVFLSRLYGLAELGFYGECDTRTPLVGQLVLGGLYIGLMVVLSRPLGVYGFAVARSGAYLVAALSMMWLLQRRFGAFLWRTVGVELARIGFGCVVMVLFMAAGMLVPVPSGFGVFAGKVAMVGVPSLFGGAGFLCFCAWLGLLPESLMRRLPFLSAWRPAAGR